MNNEEKILAMLQQIQTEQSSMKEDMSGMKEDMSGMREDISGLKEDMSGTKEDISGLKEEISSVRQSVVTIEQEHGYKLGAILDSQVDSNRNIEDLKERVGNIENRLEEVVVIKAVAK